MLIRSKLNSSQHASYLSVHVASSLFAAVLANGVHCGFKCIVFDLCHSTLFDVIRGYCGLIPLPGRQLGEMAYQLIKAIECEYRIRHIPLYSSLTNQNMP